jgi:hypothetical protein
VILYNSDFFYLKKEICLSRGCFSNRFFLEWNQAAAAAAAAVAEILKHIVIL